VERDPALLDQLDDVRPRHVQQFGGLLRGDLGDDRHDGHAVALGELPHRLGEHAVQGRRDHGLRPIGANEASLTGPLVLEQVDDRRQGTPLLLGRHDGTAQYDASGSHSVPPETTICGTRPFATNERKGRHARAGRW
jgi:hypothetical protein